MDNYLLNPTLQRGTDEELTVLRYLTCPDSRTSRVPSCEG